jgi:DNA primase
VALDTLPLDPHTTPFVLWASRFRWAGSAVLIVRDWVGRVSGFIVRPVEEKAYWRYDLYDAQVWPPFWGADVAFPQAWATRHLVLVEGVFDARALHQAGCPIAVATLGVGVSKAHRRWITRIARRVTLAFDMDAPGRAGCVQVARDLTAAGVLVSTVDYAAHDPDDLARTNPAAMAGLVARLS